jgi:hypothetical protein
MMANKYKDNSQNKIQFLNISLLLQKHGKWGNSTHIMKILKFMYLKMCKKHFSPWKQFCMGATSLHHWVRRKSQFLPPEFYSHLS